MRERMFRWTTAVGVVEREEEAPERVEGVEEATVK